MKTRPILFLALVITLLITTGSTQTHAQIDTTDYIPGATVGSDFYNNTYFRFRSTRQFPFRNRC